MRKPRPAPHTAAALDRAQQGIHAGMAWCLRGLLLRLAGRDSLADACWRQGHRRADDAERELLIAKLDARDESGRRTPQAQARIDRMEVTR